MAISMTGFGRGEGKSERYSFVAEVRTVNNRYLDMSIKMPRKVLFLEDWVRQECKKYIRRGRLEMYIKMDTENVSDSEVSLDLNLAKSYFEVLKQIGAEFHVKDDISVVNIARFPEVVKSSEAELDTDQIMEALQTAIAEAMQKLLGMREKEGRQLEQDILMRTKILEGTMQELRSHAAEIEGEYRSRIRARIAEILQHQGYEADEQRIVQEAAVYAEKSNVTEEIVRFETHIRQLAETLQKGENIGRKLDFIIQEMNREVNTIGSKSSDIHITSLVVELKSEIEKIREQVQNIE